MQIKPIRLSPLLIAILQVFIVCAGMAAEPVVHISPTPNWLLTYKPYNHDIPSRDVDNGYFYELFEEQIQVEKQADYNHIIKQIVSEAGIQNGSEISISFDPSYQRIDFHQVTVWRDGKAQSRLNSSSFKVIADEKELSKFIYQGTYSAYCILSDIRKGDRIEYAYTITGSNPIFDNKFFTDIYLQGSQSVAHQYISLQVSSARPLNFKNFNTVPKTTVSTKNGLKCYEWETFQNKPVDTYDNEPGWYDNYGHVQVTEYNNWSQVVNWAMKINPIATNIKGNLAARITTLKLAAAGNKEKYFRSAVKMVQDEIRYMGIEMGEYSHKANNPEKVYDQRYGDCKDKSLLLASVLMADSIEAHIVLINTSAREKTGQFMPSPFVFDHATVVALVNKKQVWVDATIAYQRGTGTNLYYPDYGLGLVLKQGNNTLTGIPLSPVGKITCLEKYTVPSGKGKVALDVTTTYTLNQADDIRERLASSSMSETEKNYLDYYAKTYPKIESADSVTVNDNEDKNELTTVEHYRMPDFFKPEAGTGRYSASLYADYISEQLVTVPDKVQGPVAVNYPYAMDYTINVILPSGWNVDARDTTISRDAYKFETRFSAAEDILTLNYQFSYLKGYIPADKLDEYRQDVKKISDSQLSFNFTYTPDVSNIPFRYNFWMMAFAALLTALLAFVAVRVYCTKTQATVHTRDLYSAPISGWLIFILIGLLLTTVAIPITTITHGYFNLDKWNIKALTKSDFAFKAIFTFEALGNVVIACFACFCLILMINRRDILPRIISLFYAFLVFFFAADYAAVLLINNGHAGEKAGEAVVRAIIVAAIWIPYFRISTRVKQTFVVPYPASNNYLEHQNPDRQTVATDYSEDLVPE